MVPRRNWACSVPRVPTLNVLSVIHYPIFGGPGNRNALVANRLAAAGINTHIVIPDAPGNAAERLRGMGIEPHRIPLHRLRKTLNPVPNLQLATQLAGDIKELRQLIRDLSIDVVLVNGTGNPHGAFAARKEGVPVVWQLLDTFPPLAGLAAVMPLITRMSDALMTTGLTTAAAHPGALEFAGPLVSFGPCIPVQRFTWSPETASAARAELGLGPDDFVVGNVANITKMKGHHTFVDAAAALTKRHPAKFVVLGSANDEAYLQSIRGHAARVGFTLGSDFIIQDGGARVAELSQAFDLFWMTSEPRSEGIPTAVGEAQSLGRPVVASRAGGVHEGFIAGESGFLVAPHDIDAFVEKSLLLAKDDDLRAQFGAAGAANVRKHFSVEATSLKHLEAYEAAIAAHRKR